MLMRAICLAFLSLALLTIACGRESTVPAGDSSSAPASTARQVVLNRGNGSEPDSLDPQKAQGSWEANIIGDMILGLMTEDAGGNAIAGSAEKWTVSPDGLTWTFQIRGDMNWSDGVPVTAGDFVYAFRRILDPATAAQYASLIYVIKNAQAVNEGKMPTNAVGVRALNAKTLELTLERPAPYLLSLAKHQTMFPIPKHVVEKFGADWVKSENIVVNGPYKLTEWVPNARVTLVKNPGFYDAANVQIDVVNFYPISDSSIELKRYQTGALDITNSLPSRQLDWAKATFKHAVHVQPYLAIGYAQINVSKPPFSDARVRRALSLAVDREAICYRLLNAGQVPAYSFVPERVANYADGPRLDFKSKSMDDRRAEAQALLRQAGFGPGHPLKFTYRYFDNVDDRRVAVALQDMWKRIGAEAELLNSEAKVQYDALRTQNFEVASAGWIADYDDTENFLYLFMTSTGAMNYSKYSNPEFDALMAKAARATSLAERASLLAQAETLLLRDSPLIPENFSAYRRLVRPYVKGWADNVGNWHRTRFLKIERPKAPAS